MVRVIPFVGSTLNLVIYFLVVSNALITPLDVRIQLSPKFLRFLQDKASDTGNVVVGVLDHFTQMSAKHFRTLWQHNPELGQQATNSVDAGGSLFLESFSQPVHAEQALLCQRFGWNKIRVRPGSRLTDSRCVVRIDPAAAALYPIKRHRRSRDHAGVEPTLIELAAPVVSSAARLHRNQAASRQISTPQQEPLALQGAIGDNFTCGIHGVDLD